MTHNKEKLPIKSIRREFTNQLLLKTLFNCQPNPLSENTKNGKLIDFGLKKERVDG